MSLANVNPERHEGTLTTWNDTRGYGYITPTAGGLTVFVHIKAFPSSPIRPSVGSVLTYQLASRGGREQASLVRPITAPASRPTPHSPTPALIPAKIIRTKPSPVRKQVLTRGAPIRRGLAYLTIPTFIALCVAVSYWWETPSWFFAIYVAASALSYVAYAADKHAAQKGSWRTEERTLLILGLLGGWPGAIIAQEHLRHKTRKIRFQLAFWITVILNVVTFVAIVRAMSEY